LRHRAVTLIELMVATAVVVVVAGLILGILIQSNREADLGLRRATLLSSASSTLQSISLWCERARAAPIDTPELYELNQLGLNAIDPAEGHTGFFEVQPRRQESERVIDTIHRWTSDGKEADTSGAAWMSYGGESKVWLSVSFRYAWTFDGINPQWARDEPGEGRPRAVEITVLAQDPDARVAAVRLISVVAFHDGQD